MFSYSVPSPGSAVTKGSSDQQEGLNLHAEFGRVLYGDLSERAEYGAGVVERLLNQADEFVSEDVDLVLQGSMFGDNGGPYMLGVFSVLEKLPTPLRVHRISGVGIGAFFGAAIICGVSTETLLRMYWAWFHLRSNASVSGEEDRLYTAMTSLLPENCHTLCNDRLSIHVAVLDNIPKCRVVSTFFSPADLMDTIAASCHVPFKSNGRPFFTWRRQRAISGAFLTLCPEVFPDGARTQIVVNAHRNYTTLVAGFSPSRFTASVAEAQLDTKAFLRGSSVAQISHVHPGRPKSALWRLLRATRLWAGDLVLSRNAARALLLYVLTRIPARTWRKLGRASRRSILSCALKILRVVW